MKQNILVSHLKMIHILEFIRGILFYNGENGYKMARVFKTSSINRYLVVLRPQKSSLDVMKSWKCPEKERKSKYEDRKVIFEAYDDYFVFEDKNVGGKLNFWWILFTLSRINLEKHYDASIMKFFQKQGIIYLSNWHFLENGEMITVIKTLTSQFPKLLASGEEITIYGNAYGICENVVEAYCTSEIIKINERVAKDSDGKIYLLGV